MMTVVKNCAERKKHKREEEEEGEEWKKKRRLVYNVPRPQNVQRGLLLYGINWLLPLPLLTFTVFSLNFTVSKMVLIEGRCIFH